MATYTKDTAVPVARTVDEIESTLGRFGATEFAYFKSGRHAAVMFTARHRQVRFVLPLPDADSPEFTRTPTGRARSGA